MTNELIKKAIDLSKGTCKNQYMGSESLIFGVTNENQNEVSKILDYSDKRIITTGSSGDQYLSAILNGSKDETIFDINKFAKYYIYLKIAAIRNLKLADYKNYMLPYNSDTKFFHNSLIRSLIKELSKEVQEFWYGYLSEVEKKDICNFIWFDDEKIDHLLYRLDYLKDKSYDVLQSKLKKKEYPKVLNFDANNFHYYVEDEINKYGKYDIINFSNIIECNQAAHCGDDYYYGMYGDDEWISYFNCNKDHILTPIGILFLFIRSQYGLIDYEKDYNITAFKNDVYDDTLSYGLTLKRK